MLKLSLYQDFLLYCTSIFLIIRKNILLRQGIGIRTYRHLILSNLIEKAG